MEAQQGHLAMPDADAPPQHHELVPLMGHSPGAAAAADAGAVAAVDPPRLDVEEAVLAQPEHGQEEESRGRGSGPAEGAEEGAASPGVEVEEEAVGARQVGREVTPGLVPFPSASSYVADGAAAAAAEGMVSRVAEEDEEGVPAKEVDYEELSVLAPLPFVSDAAKGEAGAAAEGSVSHGVEVEEEGVRDNDMDYEELPMLAPFPSVSDAAEGEEAVAAVRPPIVVGDLAEEDARDEQPQYGNEQEEEERGAEGAELEDRAVSHGLEADDEGIAAHGMQDVQQFPVLSPLSSDFIAADEKEGSGSLEALPVADDEATVDEDAVEEDDEEEEAASAMAVEEKELTAAVSSGRNRGGGRRKRGRPPKVQAARLPAKKKEEEDLCFICFDGGNLVVCDRRGCPKVYHPACVNRDESFFRSKGRWNCGWHICSVCEKAAHYMCFTCTYSLCKACIKEAEFVCVRGNKGLCETCRSTVVLIETGEQEKNMAGVDFDDRNSWMYLFKDYWLDLKRKLSITLEEVSRAKNPWKGPLTLNEESSDELYDAKEDLGSSSDSSSVRHEGNKPARKKSRRRSKTALGDEEPVKLPHNEGAPLLEDTEWASMELLEFVAHMRNGDKSVMCQFDVHTLLLEYIKQNNLRDPRRKSQIICDSRLEKLFGKARVGHFEMLKLLESHFLVKETSQVVTDDNQGGVVDPESNQMDTEGNSEVVPKASSDKKRRSRKRIEEREPQNNLDDYAAIDIHNISLIYLRRNLTEELLDDSDNFNDKVLGSFVRIRISGAGQRQDMYRLVQVTGTGKTMEKYKTGKRTTDITLEILNLSKTEAIPIDSISNQDFTEEECERLRQSIKCGLINRLTVRDILEKAMAIQAVRVNESLENEKLRLTHLRDRASEKGRRKELRECVEKLQLLNSPEERSRRLNDIPVVHADPNMDPNYESADEESSDRKQDNFMRSTEPRSGRIGKGMNASQKGNLGSGDSWSGSRRGSTASWESSKNIPSRGAWDKIDTSRGFVDRVNDVTLNQEKDPHQANSWDVSKTLVTAAATDAGVLSNSQPGIIPGQSSGLSSETSATSQCIEAANLSSINENEKMWHYQDPSGKIQGPFSMTQLRKWSTTGYFPANLQIWRTSEKQEESILLTDALIGKFQKEPPPVNALTQFPKVAQVMDARESKNKGNWRANDNSLAEKRKDDGSPSGNGTTISGGSTNLALTKAGGWVGQSSGWSSPTMDPVVPRDEKVGASSRVWESKHQNAWSSQPQAHNPPMLSAAPISGNTYQLSAQQGRGRGGNADRWKGGPNHGNTWGSNRSAAFHSSGHGYGRQQSANYVHPGQQSPGELWKAQAASNSNYWRSDSLNLPTPTPRPTVGGWIGNHSIGYQSSASLSVSVQPAASGWAGTATHGGNTLQFPIVGGNEASFSACAEQPPPTAQAPTHWGPNPSLPTGIGASWDLPVTATISVATGNVLADGLGASHTASVQSVPYLSSGQTSSANNSAPEAPAEDEKLKPAGGKIDGFVSVATLCDFSKNSHMKDDCPSPTPREEQDKFGALISESSHQNSVDVDSKGKSFEAPDVLASGHPLESADSGQFDATAALPAAMRTPKYSANNSPESDIMQEKGKVLAVNMTPPEGNISQMLPLESFLKDTNMEVNQSLHFSSSPQNGPPSSEHLSTKRPGGPDDLEFQSCEKHVVERSDPDHSAGSHVKVSDVSERRETDIVVLNPASKGDALEQGHTQNPREAIVFEPAKSSNLGLPAGRTEWSMPSPTPAIEPSRSHTGAESAFPVTQPSAQWNSSMHLDPGPLSNLYQGPGNKEIEHMDAGLSQENMINALEPAKGSGQIDLGSTVPGNMSAGLGPLVQGNATMVQGNTNGVWANPTQGNANMNVGWTAPAQANANMNMFWVALAQANPSWGNPVPGNENPNVTPNPGWVLNAPMSTPPVSNWGAVTPPVNPNTNQNWGPAQVNVNAVSGWPASQSNANPNPGWLGQGNMNMGYNTPAGNPGNWGTQQKPNADGYPAHNDRGFQSNDAGHGGGRHGWNRSQNSGGGSSSRAPPRGQRVGICKYHESGHCKKGAHCNYLHT